MNGPLKIGALFAGYGGLDEAVSLVLPARVAWLSEFDDGPSRILAHRYPHAPNLGDVTKVDWTAVEPVDVITGGSPCQDLSHAGKRAGMKDGTRSGLWAAMCNAVETIRPQLVLWENVRGALSAEATAGDVESCEFCVGDPGEPPLRALGRVLGDLAELGYDAAWYGLRAADVGAPHGRWRVFVLAWDAADTEGDPRRLRYRDGATAPAPRPAGLTLLPTPEAKLGSSGPDYARASRPGTGGDSLHEAVGRLLPTPTTQPATGNGHARNLGEEARLLPTPVVNDMGRAYTPETWDEWTERLKASHGNGNGHGPSLHVEALRMLPTPRATDGTKGGPNQRGSSGDLMLPSAVTLLPTPSAASPDSRRAREDGTTYSADGYPREQLGDVLAQDRFGDYAPAIARWEAVLGRPAPSPTEPTGKDGAHRLSARFVEFMMGLPDGWVTDPVIWEGMKATTARNAQLKALGNGVVPQQAAAALERMLALRATSLAGEVTA